MEGVVIPYTAERRPDTGVSNGTLGIWLFLASEAMLFGALFSAYALLRTSAAEWPVGRDVLGTDTVFVTTFALFLASSCVWDARTRTKGQHFLLLLSSSTALLFLLAKGFEYSDKLSTVYAGVQHVPGAVLHSDWFPCGSRAGWPHCKRMGDARYVPC